MNFHEIAPLAFLGRLSPWEIGLILALVLLLFGAKKLPELARSTGKALREFKKATSEAEETFKTAMKEEPAPEAENKTDSSVLQKDATKE